MQDGDGMINSYACLEKRPYRVLRFDSCETDAGRGASRALFCRFLQVAGWAGTPRVVHQVSLCGLPRVDQLLLATTSSAPRANRRYRKARAGWEGRRACSRVRNGLYILTCH